MTLTKRFSRMGDAVEDEQCFLSRRAAEEQRKAAETPCIVSFVHEEMAELYDERRAAIEAETGELNALLDQLG